jgi:UDP-N-acetylmuramate--alanine ligase
MRARQRRVHRRRGRRVRRVLPAPAPVMAVVTNIDADHMETYGHDFAGSSRPSSTSSSTCPSTAPRCSASTTERARDHALRVQADHPLRPRRRRRSAPWTSAGDGTRMLFRRAASANGPRAKLGRAEPARPAQRANALAAIAVADEVGRIRSGHRPALASSRASAGASSATARCPLRPAVASRWSTTTATTRSRWRRRWPRRAAPSRAAAWCSRSSRTATRARATASRTSCGCCRPSTCCCWPRCTPAGEAPIVAADGRALARALRVAGGRAGVRRGHRRDLPAAILAVARDGDVVVTMGAGPSAGAGACRGKLAHGSV